MMCISLLTTFGNPHPGHYWLMDAVYCMVVLCGSGFGFPRSCNTQRAACLILCGDVWGENHTCVAHSGCSVWWVTHNQASRPMNTTNEKTHMLASHVGSLGALVYSIELQGILCMIIKENKCVSLLVVYFCLYDRTKYLIGDFFLSIFPSTR